MGITIHIEAWLSRVGTSSCQMRRDWVSYQTNQPSLAKWPRFSSFSLADVDAFAQQETLSRESGFLSQISRIQARQSLSNRGVGVTHHNKVHGRHCGHKPLGKPGK